MRHIIEEGTLPFLVALIIAFILSYIPILRAPFSWMMTYFHEISHGLAAIITGGSVVNIELHLRGSGLCYTAGGIRFFVTFAGYAGATLWGILLYTAAVKLNKKYSDEAAYAIAATIIITGALWARDLMTIAIMIIMAVMFLTFARLKDSAILKIILQITACYILLDAMLSPLDLIDGRSYGDGATLSKQTGIPEIIWAGIWLSFGIASLYYVYRCDKLKKQPLLPS